MYSDLRMEHSALASGRCLLFVLVKFNMVGSSPLHFNNRMFVS
jgi:hypothetical protein